MSVISNSFRFSLLFLFIVLAKNVFSQTCTHVGLSKKYNFKTHILRFARHPELDSFTIAVIIIDKQSGEEVQKIAFSSTYLFSSVYTECGDVRSYITGVNANKVEVDNDFGDVIIADLNFDGKEDLVLKKDSGGNSGPVYNFYIQNKVGQFFLDDYLTNKVEFFPVHINKVRKTLVTHTHANVGEFGEHTYKLDAKTNMWKQINHRLIPLEY